jgi:osmotically-inducible protein OsmY
MNDHRKLLAGRALRLATLVASGLVAGALAAMLVALSACRTAEPARLQADDSTITAKIQAKLASLAATSANGDLDPSRIAVTTKNGVVTLEGRVKKDDTREEIERDARDTDGVQRVIDLVKVGDLQ